MSVTQYPSGMSNRHRPHFHDHPLSLYGQQDQAPNGLFDGFSDVLDTSEFPYNNQSPPLQYRITNTFIATNNSTPYDQSYQNEPPSSTCNNSSKNSSSGNNSRNLKNNGGPYFWEYPNNAYGIAEPPMQASTPLPYVNTTSAYLLDQQSVATSSQIQPYGSMLAQSMHLNSPNVLSRFQDPSTEPTWTQPPVLPTKQNYLNIVDDTNR